MSLSVMSADELRAQKAFAMLDLSDAHEELRQAEATYRLHLSRMHTLLQVAARELSERRPPEDHLGNDPLDLNSFRGLSTELLESKREALLMARKRVEECADRFRIFGSNPAGHQGDQP